MFVATSLINKYNYKQDDVAQAVGKSRSHIANIIRLLSLSELAKDCLMQNKLTIGQIRPLIGHSDCDHLLDIIVKNKLTSRQVEKLHPKLFFHATIVPYQFRSMFSYK